MNLHNWIDEVCDVLDIEVDVDESLVVDVARDAGEAVDRPAAPVTAFLLGYAAAGSAGDPETVERLAGLVTDLAGRWDRPADEVEDDEEEEVVGDARDVDLSGIEDDEDDEADLDDESEEQ